TADPGSPKGPRHSPKALRFAGCSCVSRARLRAPTRTAGTADHFTRTTAEDAVQPDHDVSGTDAPNASDEPRDICPYCGADNGPVDQETGHGVSRQGWYCYFCTGC